MKKLVIFFLLISNLAYSQTAKDLFVASDVKVTWLGIDFSHIKLIGDFSQFAGAGQTGAIEIKDKYFSGWNNLIVNEYDKYNIGEMIRKENVALKISSINKINEDCSVEDLEAEAEPNYTKETIAEFIKSYDLGEKSGIGILFVTESFNKIKEEGTVHFIAINLANNEILLHEKFVTKPGGFGLRNYWAKCFGDVIETIRTKKYKAWKKEYGG